MFMCGIAGLIGRIDETNRTALKRMNDAMSHRGPDGEGFWEASPDDAGWGVMLAHWRLSILDPTNAAAQPIVDPTDGVGTYSLGIRTRNLNIERSDLLMLQVMFILTASAHSRHQRGTPWR